MKAPVIKIVSGPSEARVTPQPSRFDHPCAEQQSERSATFPVELIFEDDELMGLKVGHTSISIVTKPTNYISCSCYFHYLIGKFSISIILLALFQTF